jgi:nucleoside-diphosphate-sugar epimerase
MKTVLVTGSNGMLGKAICNKFISEGIEVIGVTREKVDLRNSQNTLKFFSKYEINLIVHCAAIVGGIQANIKGGTKFFLENILIDNSVLFAARYQGVKNLIYIGSSCMYPANVDHSLKEDELLAGPLEPTNENYALAKLFGSRMTSSIAIEDDVNWRVFVASNLYGPNDHFNTDKSHLLAAIISKAVSAKENNLKSIEMWGDGTPKREFTHVIDFADWVFDSSLFLKRLPFILNTGIGQDYSVVDYYKKVLTALNLDITVAANLKMPNGNYRKLMDSTLARNFGWNPKINIDEGIKSTIKWYLENRIAN